jgi:hypothetical protein
MDNKPNLDGFKVKSFINTSTPDQLIKALQINLGYSPNTHIPTIDEFIENDYYLGKSTDNGKAIYKFWREELRRIFPNPLQINYNTVFLRSAIGVGKSTVSRIIILYVIAKMILMDNPHKFFGLLPGKDLVVFFYAMQLDTINAAMLSPIYPLVENSDFFKANMDPTKKRGLHFKNNITIKTGSTIGKNVGLDVFLVFMDRLVAMSPCKIP